MKTGVSWIIWLLLIILLVFFFPKACGHKINNTENINQISESEDSFYDEIQEDTSISTEGYQDEIPVDELSINDLPPEDPGISGEVISDINNENNSSNTSYKCFGIKDFIIKKINKNSSIQWCYGICLEKDLDKNSHTNQKNETSKEYPAFFNEMTSSFPKMVLIVIVILIVIFIINLVKNISAKSQQIQG